VRSVVFLGRTLTCSRRLASPCGQVRSLTARVEELEAEVACGGHSERKIMELAAAQARREAVQRADLEGCQLAAKKLQHALEEKVGEGGGASTGGVSLGVGSLSVEPEQVSFRWGFSLRTVGRLVVLGGMPMER
jgi:hypothetical protein